ncbi:unnamed protein product [Nesidiocoris tenuis]|uniref:Uncharacterized protein n=1 Tax=Nesidiocoris tenuis TaxID=355587 RepID=A0A6H5GP56_9HEMI|nr:unnamed protein product [Nesidiocoris tenuis]
MVPLLGHGGSRRSKGHAKASRRKKLHFHRGILSTHAMYEQEARPLRARGRDLMTRTQLPWASLHIKTAKIIQSGQTLPEFPTESATWD